MTVDEAVRELQPYALALQRTPTEEAGDAFEAKYKEVQGQLSVADCQVLFMRLFNRVDDARSW